MEGCPFPGLGKVISLFVQGFLFLPRPELGSVASEWNHELHRGLLADVVEDGIHHKRLFHCLAIAVH